MPDITLCTGESCPQARQCYRTQATPSEFRQAWFTVPPIKDGVCAFYHLVGTAEEGERRRLVVAHVTSAFTMQAYPEVPSAR